MHSTIEVSVLCTRLKRVLISKFNNIGLTTLRPPHLRIVVAHLPERRPKAIGCLRELNARVNTSEGIIRLT